MTKQNLKDKIFDSIQELKKQMLDGDYYGESSPSYIAIFVDKNGELEVRQNTDKGFMDELHNKVKEIFRIDTSNNESQIRDMIREGLTQEQEEKYFETNDLAETLGEDFEIRRELIIEDQIQNCLEFAGEYEGIAKQASQFLEGLE